MPPLQLNTSAPTSARMLLNGVEIVGSQAGINPMPTSNGTDASVAELHNQFLLNITGVPASVALQVATTSSEAISINYVSPTTLVTAVPTSASLTITRQQ
jgi:hypothetical protein